MRFRHRYIDPIMIYLLVYIFGIVLFSVGTTLARYLYEYMNHLVPSVFPLFSPVSEKEGYDAYLKLIDVVGIFAAVFLINLFAMSFDNKKFELMVSRTDGQYTVREGLVIYVREFLRSDAISAVLFPAALTLAPYLIPKIPKTEKPIINLLIDLLERFFWLGNTAKEYFGLFMGLMIVALFSVISRALLIPHILKRWRAAWLSDI